MPFGRVSHQHGEYNWANSEYRWGNSEYNSANVKYIWENTPVYVVMMLDTIVYLAGLNSKPHLQALPFLYSTLVSDHSFSGYPGQLPVVQQL